MTALTEQLETIAAQRVFRVLLETLSRPGRIADLPRELVARQRAPFLPVLCLADIETSLHVITDDPSEAETVLATTGAQHSPIGDADMVVATRPILATEIDQIRRGDAHAPEQGARVVLACESLGESGVSLRLSGPGVGPSLGLTVAGLAESVFESISRANAAFPAGIDIYLVTPAGRIAAIPRSTAITIEGAN